MFAIIRHQFPLGMEGCGNIWGNNKFPSGMEVVCQENGNQMGFRLKFDLVEKILTLCRMGKLAYCVCYYEEENCYYEEQLVLQRTML